MRLVPDGMQVGHPTRRHETQPIVYYFDRR